MQLRSVTSLVSLSLCVVALGACGDDGNVTSTNGQTDGQTTANPDPTTTTIDPDPTTAGISASEGTVDASGTMGDSQTDTGQTTAPIDEGTSSSGGSTTLIEGETDTMAAPECGNRMVEGSEECDDGNQDPGDGCEPDCTVTPAVCGNELVEEGEVCDDGNTEDGDLCSADCTEAFLPQECGNGTVEEPETCDDMNDVAGDGCEPDCTITPRINSSIVTGLLGSINMREPGVRQARSDTATCCVKVMRF